MTAVMRPQASACPACSAAPAAEALAEMAEDKEAKLALSVPTVHCALCISTIERELAKRRGCIRRGLT